MDELLCYGWIDGIALKLDETRTMQMISPRKAQHWTKTYKDRFAKLEKEGRMIEAGLQSVLITKQKALWNFMDDVDSLIKPADFIKCLEEHAPALRYFDAFGASIKRFMLRYIKLAKTSETRAKRINQITVLVQKAIKLPDS